MLVDRLPLPSNVPIVLVCHWLNGSATFVLCNSVHVAPAEPLLAVMPSVVPLKLIPVMCGSAGPLDFTFKMPLIARVLVSQARPAPASPEQS